MGYVSWCHQWHILSLVDSCYFEFLPRTWWWVWKKFELEQLRHLKLLGWMTYHLDGSKTWKYHSFLAIHSFEVGTQAEETQWFHAFDVDAVKYQQEFLCWRAPCLHHWRSSNYEECLITEYVVPSELAPLKSGSLVVDVVLWTISLYLNDRLACYGTWLSRSLDFLISTCLICCLLYLLRTLVRTCWNSRSLDDELNLLELNLFWLLWWLF